MIKIFSIAIGIAMMSSFFFPFVFTFFPYANTKMILAACGLILFLFRLAMFGHGSLNRDSFILSLCALGVSFASLAAMIWNDTMDSSYLSYIVSMWVWLGAAYFVVSFIKRTHGRISVEIICYYLVLVGTFQCLIAIAIDLYPSVERFVDTFLDGTGYMGKKEGRLYGIGCSTDVGGTRLAALLILNVYLIFSSFKYKNYLYRIIFLFVTFSIITVLGNMIARTTTVGLIISLILFFYLLIKDREISIGQKRFLLNIFVIGIVLVFIVFSFLYATNDAWKYHLEFGFEGFFSLVEKGEWEVHSNEMLKEGFVFPDNTKTWIIGDGYMGDPDLDPNYIGPESWGFYMNTDVGYSRFIFYFGLIGLGMFSLFFIKACQICMKRFEKCQMMFFLILVLNFCIWLKVTTDIFLVFAPFLCLSARENGEYEEFVSCK